MGRGETNQMAPERNQDRRASNASLMFHRRDANATLDLGLLRQRDLVNVVAIGDHTSNEFREPQWEDIPVSEGGTTKGRFLSVRCWSIHTATAIDSTAPVM